MSPLMRYRLRIQGYLGPAWEEQFAGFVLIPEPDGNTVLTGTVTEQAALHRLLARIRDLGLTLISVNEVQKERAQETESG